MYLAVCAFAGYPLPPQHWLAVRLEGSPSIRKEVEGSMPVGGGGAIIHRLRGGGMVCGVWCVVYGVWCMVCGVWCVGVWGMVYVTV
jgi:hypothetical protein